MNRKKEIIIILKELLAKEESNINKNQFSNDEADIIKSCRDCVTNSQLIETYLKEYEKS